MAPAVKRKKASADDAAPAQGTPNEKRQKTQVTKDKAVTKPKAAPRGKVVAAKPKVAPKGKAAPKKKAAAKTLESDLYGELAAENGEVHEEDPMDTEQNVEAQEIGEILLPSDDVPTISPSGLPDDTANSGPDVRASEKQLETTDKPPTQPEATATPTVNPEAQRETTARPEPTLTTQPTVAPNLPPMTASGKRQLTFADDPDFEDEPTSHTTRNTAKPKVAPNANAQSTTKPAKRKASTQDTEDVLEDIEEGGSSEPSQKRQRTATVTVAGKEKRKSALLYDRCVLAKPIGEHFSVQELTNFDIADDQDDLKALTQELVDHHLFTPLHLNRGFLYRARTKEVAIKLAKLSLESHMIYQHIEGSGAAGTWKRTLVLKTNLHENTITRSLKDLVAKGLVREIKSAKYPTRRIYLLAHIKPSADNLGGTFFDGGVLDEGMVHEVKKVAFFTIEQASWAKKEVIPTPKDLAATRPGKKIRPKWRYIPHPPDYAHYPTPLDVLNSILDSGILKGGVSFVEDDILQLLKNLEYDGQIERMRNAEGKLTNGYRSVRRGALQGTKPSTVGFEQGLLGIVEKDIAVVQGGGGGTAGEGPGNGFTDIPCGRCEVFSRCRPGGVVSPEGCRYMEQWLDF